MAKKVAVLLAGCGHRDGAEIQESICTLLALDKAGAQIVGVAPDYNQLQVTNHLNGSAMDERRNIMVEAARIMRGNVHPISDMSAEDFDALIMPGGFGVALNFCNYGTTGRYCEIDKEVKRFILNFVQGEKPVGAICIAPVVVAKALEGSGIYATLTIGNDPKMASDIETMGAKHKNCIVSEAVVDHEHKIVSTPAYMLAKRISEIEAGINKLVTEIMMLA